MLVIVHDRDVEFFVQNILDLKAFGGGNVLELDGAEGRSDVPDRLDDHLGVLARNQDRDTADPDQAVEQGRLAFHDRHAGYCADVAQAEDRRTVGHDRHLVGNGSVLVGQLRLLLDVAADGGHAGGVDLAHHADTVEGQLALHGNFAAFVELVDQVDHILNDDPLNLGQIVEDAFHLLLGIDIDRHLPHVVGQTHADQADVADVAARHADRRGQLAEEARLVEDHHPQGFCDFSGTFFNFHERYLPRVQCRALSLYGFGIIYF